MNANLFKDHVERVVGPVAAGASRKDRMREELAAHLEASFAEERRHPGDDREAAERAIRRLGDPDALTRSLQGSVPRLERVLHTRLLPEHRLETWGRRRRDESVRRYAIRITGWMTAIIAAADLVVLSVAAVTRGRPLDGRVVVAWGTAQVLFVAAGSFIFPFLWEAMARALQAESSGRGRYRAALRAALLSSLVVSALTLAFVLIVTVLGPHGQVFRWADWLVVLTMALVAPVALLLGARDTISWRLRRDGWDLPERPS